MSRKNSDEGSWLFFKKGGSTLSKRTKGKKIKKQSRVKKISQLIKLPEEFQAYADLKKMLGTLEESLDELENTVESWKDWADKQLYPFMYYDALKKLEKKHTTIVKQFDKISKYLPTIEAETFYYHPTFGVLNNKENRLSKMGRNRIIKDIKAFFKSHNYKVEVKIRVDGKNKIIEVIWDQSKRKKLMMSKEDFASFYNLVSKLDEHYGFVDFDPSVKLE